MEPVPTHHIRSQWQAREPCATGSPSISARGCALTDDNEASTRDWDTLRCAAPGNSRTSFHSHNESLLEKSRKRRKETLWAHSAVFFSTCAVRSPPFFQTKGKRALVSLRLGEAHYRTPARRGGVTAELRSPTTVNPPRRGGRQSGCGRGWGAEEGAPVGSRSSWWCETRDERRLRLRDGLAGKLLCGGSRGAAPNPRTSPVRT